jgi:hypothetical protein
MSFAPTFLIVYQTADTNILDLYFSMCAIFPAHIKIIDSRYFENIRTI